MEAGALLAILARVAARTVTGASWMAGMRPGVLPKTAVKHRYPHIGANP